MRRSTELPGAFPKGPFIPMHELSFGLAVDMRRTFTILELKKRAFDFTLIEAGSYLVGWSQNR